MKLRTASLLACFGVAPACAGNARTPTGSAVPPESPATSFAPQELPAPIVIVGAATPADTDGGVRATFAPELSPDRTPPGARPGPLGSLVLVGEPGDGAAFTATGAPRALHLVVDAPYESWAGEGTFVHVVALSPAMRPCAGAEVYLGRRRVGRADAHGTFVFRPAPSSDLPSRGSLDVTCRVGGALLRGAIAFAAHARTATFERATVFVHTDRGIYAPGETVRVRALAWRLRGEYEPLDAQTLGVRLATFDASRGTVTVTGGALRTDAYGAGSLELPLDDALPEGEYQLLATLGERTATARLRVERARHPAIEIRASGDRFFTSTTTAVDLDVSLRAVDDAPVTRARLALSLARDGLTVPVLERDVAGAGPHRVTIPGEALTRLRGGAQSDIPGAVVLRVTDASGRDDTLRRPLTFTDFPYELVVTLDRERHAPGEEVALSATLRTFDRELAAGRRLRLRGVTPEVEAVTGADGTAQMRFSMPDREAPVSVEVVGVSRPLWSDTLRAGRAPLASTVAEPTVREREAVNVTVRFPADVEPVEDVVHADVTDASGAIISSFLLPLSRDAQPTARGTFRAPSWGTMLVSLFALAAPRGQRDPRAVGLVTGGQTVPVAASTGALDVTLRGLPPTVRPGERLRVTAEVRRDGALVDAELGAWFVDSAISGLLDPLPVAPWRWFYSAEAKVLATTGAQTLTWPRLDRTWGDARVDLCWPARFGYYGGSLDPVRRARRVYLATDMIECRGEVAPDHGAAPELVVRAESDPTTTWSPALMALDGRADIDLVATSEITHQQLNVIASDRRGGVGLARVEVPVRQDFYVRSDVPATLREGVATAASLVARNLGAATVTARLSMRSPDLDVRPSEPVEVRVSPGASATARFTVTARTPGVARYETRGESPAITDVAQRTVAVAPAGEPAVSVSEATLAAGRRYETNIASGGARYTTATLSVEFPTVVSLSATFKALASELGGGASSLASRLSTASSLYNALHSSTDRAAQAESRRALRASIAALAPLSNADGGYAWTAGGPSSLLATTWILEAMRIARISAWEEFPPDRFTEARQFLLAAIEAGATWQTPELVALEGDSPRSRDALMAQVFAVVVDEETVDRPAIERLAAAVEAIAADPSASVLTRAYALSGLVWREQVLERRDGPYGRSSGVRPRARPFDWEGLRARRAREVEALLVACRERRDEPGWLDAWGGAIAATSRGLDLLRTLAPSRAGAFEREAVERALASRPSWGAAHDARTAQWALRTLASVSQGEERQGATVIVRANGRDVARVEVGGSASWAAALALARVDLTPFLRDGRARVEVRYDGALEGVVTLTTRRWTPPPGAVNRP